MTKNMNEDARYLSEQIITYIGNKRSLLEFIGRGVSIVQKRLNKTRLNCLDLFSGSGIVSRYLKQYSSSLYVNDLENYSKIINECYLSNKTQQNWEEIIKIHEFLENEIKNNLSNGFITDLYAPKNEENINKNDRVFYTRRNAMYIDTARELIKYIPQNKQKFFLAPLLYEASVHNNTAGVFKGFYKNKDGVGQFGGTGRNSLSRILGDINLKLPVLSKFECDYRVLQEDAKNAISLLPEIDFAYLDPPYNQHPYGSNYFMLNLIVENKCPKTISRVSGIPENWNRSLYNKKLSAQKELFDVISRCPAKFILISYNSEGFIEYKNFIFLLTNLGKVRSLKTVYNAFRGSRNLRTRPITVMEYLFLLEKY